MNGSYVWWMAVSQNIEMIQWGYTENYSTISTFKEIIHYMSQSNPEAFHHLSFPLIIHKP